MYKRNDGNVKANLSHIVHLYANSFKPHKIVNNRRNSKNVAIFKLDRDYEIALLCRTNDNRCTLNKMNDSLNCNELVSDSTVNREDKSLHILRYFRNNNRIDSNFESLILQFHTLQRNVLTLDFAKLILISFFNEGLLGGTCSHVPC